ncbi:MAG: DNA-binding protein WhiA [Mollicutes bacterium]|nr:DNA-binding protein WhiA [Mollicutes bacterium]
MTFTTALKEELSKKKFNILEAHFELEGFLRCSNILNNNKTIVVENASVARKIYTNIKHIFDIKPKIIIRIQKRFRAKQIYILDLKEVYNIAIEYFGLNSKCSMLDNKEEKLAFLQGAFLAVGNISNPQTSGYHLEYICNNDKVAKFIKSLLIDFNFKAKIVNRKYKSVVYLKSGDDISDLLKLFKATSSLFFFEDIRIYRDHKNMVNRINNCEISNQTRSIETGLKQIKSINYLEENNLLELFDDKTKIIIDARKKYPEFSLSELAQVISLEYNYNIGKSGVNHHFRKINELIRKHKINNKVGIK